MNSPKIDPKSPDFWRDYSRELMSGKVSSKCLRPETWDKAAARYDDLEQCRDYLRHVEMVMDLLKDKVLRPETTVLDVACGTGAYALRMAPLCRSVTALDISPGMLQRLEKKAASAGLDNVETILADWTRFTPEQTYDLVFASMTPLARSAEAIDKLLSCSRRFLCLVSWAGIRENQLLKELYLEIMGEPLQQKGMDIVLPFNYLYSLGYAPELKFFRGCWEKRRSVESQIENMIWRLELYRPLSETEKELVAEKIRKLARKTKGTGTAQGMDVKEKEDTNQGAGAESSPGDVSVVTKVRTCVMLIDKEAEGFECQS